MENTNLMRTCSREKNKQKLIEKNGGIAEEEIDDVQLEKETEDRKKFIEKVPMVGIVKERYVSRAGNRKTLRKYEWNKIARTREN